MTAEELFARVLALLGGATDAPDAKRDNLVSVEHSGLTINYHDTRCSNGPECPCCPPMCINIWDDVTKETVFYGMVDPEDATLAQVDEWKRGPWERALAAPH